MTFKTEGDWFYRTWQSASGKWVAECKLRPFIHNTFEPGDVKGFLEPGDLWFEFGNTEDEAIEKLKASPRLLV